MFIPDITMTPADVAGAEGVNLGVNSRGLEEIQLTARDVVYDTTPSCSKKGSPNDMFITGTTMTPAEAAGINLDAKSRGLEEIQLAARDVVYDTTPSCSKKGSPNDMFITGTTMTPAEIAGINLDAKSRGLEEIQLSARDVVDNKVASCSKGSPNDMFLDGTTMTPAEVASINLAANTRGLEEIQLAARDVVDDTAASCPKGLPNNMVHDDTTFNHDFIGVPASDDPELDDKRKTQSRGLLADTSGELTARDIVDDYIAQVIKSRDVNPEQMMQARRWKRYDDLAAGAAALILREVNSEELARRDSGLETVARRGAVDDFINALLKSRDLLI